MSFGTRISFGRWCRGQLFSNNKEHGYGSPAGYISAKTITHWGDKEIIIKHPPEKPSKVEKNEEWTYYYDEDDHCYGMVRNWFDKDD